MKKTSLFLILLLIVSTSFSQIGSVENYIKISSTESNFTGVLHDGDGFSECETIGDLDNDGYEDIVVGTKYSDDGGTEKGAVWILFLNEDRTVKSYQKISSLEGNFSGDLDVGDNFGSSVAAVGDIDNDGISDIAVGARNDGDGAYHSGAVWILFMNTNGTVKSYQKISATQGGLVGLTQNRLFGSSVCDLGDLNNDGTPDIAIGSPLYDDDGGLYRGCVWVLFLNTDGTVKAQQKINDYNGNFDVILEDRDRLGYGLSNIGDINNDNINDITVCALYDDDGGTNVGAAYILFLNTDGTVKSYQKISATQGNFNGNLNDEDHFGSTSAGIGDINNDGINDIALGSTNDDDGGTDKGAVWIIMLNNDGTVKEFQKISATQGNFNGDLDNDDRFGAFSHFKTGKKELIASTVYDDDGGTDRGAVWILDLNCNYINNQLVAGNLSICLGSSTGDIMLSTYSCSITDWEKRIDAGSWQSIGHTGNVYSEIPLIDGVWEYRVNFDNGLLYSTIATVIVNPSAISGTAFTLEDEICKGNSATVTLSDYEGSIQWQQSADSSDWINISGATSDTYTSDALTSTLFYRAILSLGSCPDAISNSVKINVIESPEADFFYSTNYQEVSFTNNSVNATDYLWNFGDGNTSTNKNPIHTYSASDTYTVMLTASNSICPNDNYSENILVIFVGIPGIEPNTINISPNPSENFILITVKNGALKNAKYQIYDISGKKVTAGIFKNKIAVSELYHGIYFIKIISQDNVFTGKFIKK